ncbi:hypothetical protein AHS86_23655 [Salmonella enterica subsp. enterica]|nr:hypothetical protein [Salmonella enterica subsp. enterica]EBX9174497.1 hypothetical protein [Salmonella enterica subsp. enterica serovar Kandla]EGI5886315.1 hypothetical protein [Salmonella enterica subsp. enterica serovar Magwa]EBX9805254.1 hypothetical protein [Salmonella enterica subsp. enterica serovar Kandla]EBY1906906.1 hypothetical protein [Salmonella enterica subsp. enterica serovar Kandla]
MKNYTMLNMTTFHYGTQLSPGTVAEEQFKLLIDISTIRSNRIIVALKDYFVQGVTRKEICKKYNLSAGYLSVKIKEIQMLCRQIIEIYPYFC